MNGKQRCMAALRGESMDRVPVFPLLMFFATDRAGMTYRHFATDGSAMAEAQLAVQERFAVDAITACSDAFRISADLGGQMVYPEDGTPFLSQPLVGSLADLRHLPRPDPLQAGNRMADRVRGVATMSRAAGSECLVLGWVDMPFAEACSVCGVTNFLLMLLAEPALAHSVLDFLTGIVIDFALAQLAAGAPMIGAGDAAASLISPAMYRRFALPYEQQVCSAIHAAGGSVKLHICGNTSSLLPDMVSADADLYNVDHLVDFDKAVSAYGTASKCFKGNLDPVADFLQATPLECQQRAVSCLAKADGKRYMLSAGCEIPAAVTDEVFHAFFQAPRVFAATGVSNGAR